MTSRDLYGGFAGELYPQVHDIRFALGEDATVRLEYDSSGIKVAVEWRGLKAGALLPVEQVRADGGGLAAKNFAAARLIEALQRAAAGAAA